MSTDIDLQRLQSEVRRLEESLAAVRSATTRTQRTSLAIGLTMAAIIGGFLLVNYFNFRAELTPEKLQASIEQQLKDVSPAAIREFGQLGQELLPVYAEEWKRQFQAAWPAIKDRVDTEITLLADHAVDRIDRHLNACEANVLQECQDLMIEHYPQLNDPKAQAAMAQRIHEICDGSLQKALDGFNTLFVKDMQRVQRAIVEFDFPTSDVSTVELQKKFLHLWLQLVDQEIMQL